jgi:hypothetical protein
MTEGVENLILEQLRLIRNDIAGVKTDLSQFKEEVRHDLLGQLVSMNGLAYVIGETKQRVEQIEQKLGISE